MHGPIEVQDCRTLRDLASGSAMDPKASEATPAPSSATAPANCALHDSAAAPMSAPELLCPGSALAHLPGASLLPPDDAEGYEWESHQDHTSDASPIGNNDSDEEEGSTKRNKSSDEEEIYNAPIDISFSYLSGREACRSMTTGPLCARYSAGHCWRHLRACNLDMQNLTLMLDETMLHEYVKLIFSTAVRIQLAETPGRLRVTLIRIAC